jgi:hypothetical protein
LGEFSPIGRLFTFGSFVKITEVCSPNFWATFFHGEGYAFVLTKNRVGYFLGNYYAKSSGHSAGNCSKLMNARVGWAKKILLPRSSWSRQQQQQQRAQELQVCT